jgi:protein-S-isoprenylcysteine O-methyltransferase Ste14
MHVNLTLLSYPWIVLGVLWLVAAVNQKAAIQKQPLCERLLHTLVALLGVFLLARPWPHLSWLSIRFVPATKAVFRIGFALEIAACAFACWARITLGRNWSGRPSLKSGHELMTSGPYAVTRHPIYTGLIFAALGTSLAIGEWRCVLGVLMIVLAFLLKMRTEERLMAQAFPETYPKYKQHVKALIPGVF